MFLIVWPIGSLHCLLNTYTPNVTPPISDVGGVARQFNHICKILFHIHASVYGSNVFLNFQSTQHNRNFTFMSLYRNNIITISLHGTGIEPLTSMLMFAVYFFILYQISREEG